MTPNDATLRLILDYEVGGGQPYYDRHLRFPCWPGGASGVTIGIGYDLGYNVVQAFASAWADRIGQEKVVRLTPCVLIRGAAAAQLLETVRDVEIPWPDAWAVFQNVDVPGAWAQTLRAFPGVESLPANTQGALLSLVFNRGNSLSGPRRAEMLEIRGCVDRGDVAGIAEQITAMKRLWAVGEDGGLLARRDAEAALCLSV